MYREEFINSSIYIKLATLLHENLNDNKAAQELYEKCIKIDPNNEQCWFNYGKLMFKENNLLISEQCYLKCKTPRACVQYHYALLLLSKSSSNDRQTQRKALDLLQEATKLQPNVAKYQHQYALCLQQLKLFKDADKSFKSAIKLSNHEDISMLFDYSVFLSKYMNDYESALKYLQIAMELDPTKQCQYIHDEYWNLQKYVDRNDGIDHWTNNVEVMYDADIRLLIYEFDETITYWNVDKVINGDLNKLQYMRKTELWKSIYGGNSRITRLHCHFERILSSANNAKIVILSFNYSNIITITLGRVGLMTYFTTSDIIAVDTSLHLNQTKNKLTDIIELAKQFKIKLSTQVLFIDDKLKYIKSVANHCKTYHVYSPNKLNGLSAKHMKDIEKIMGVYETDIVDTDQSTGNLSIPLNQIDCSVYANMKKEIGAMNHCHALQTLPIIKWMEEHWKDHASKDYFMEFAIKYQIVRESTIHRDEWTVSQIMPELLAMSPHDAELQRRYAVCLFNLGHYKEAEYYYKLAIQHNHYLHKQEYAYFLFKTERYTEAEEMYQKCLARHEAKNESQPLLGYAQVLEYMEQPHKAEKYYLNALECSKRHWSRNKHGLINYLYASFLCKQGRYEESKYQFEKALDIDRNCARNHYGLSKILLNMKMYEEYEYHLKRALDLDPELLEAQKDWDRYYAEDVDVQHDGSGLEQKCNDVEVEEKKQNVSTMKETAHNRYCIEFDRFWFDGIGILTADFNGYYDNFLSNNMNDIRCILFDKNITSELQSKIGVKSWNDMQIIIRNIRRLQDEHRVFVEKLNGAKLNDLYAMFACNGIYTLEAFGCYVKCKQDIKKLIKRYNEQKHYMTNQFDINDNVTINRLWEMVAFHHHI